MAFTAQLGKADSQLGNIVLGLGAEAAPYFDKAIKFRPALPEEVGWHHFRRVPTQTLADAPATPPPWYPVPLKQELDRNQPGYVEPPKWHHFRQLPIDTLTGLPVIPPDDINAPGTRNIPLLSRDPQMPPVMRRFTDIVSGVFNSLTRTGQLVQTGAMEFEIHATALPSQTVQIASGTEPDPSPYYGLLWVDGAGELHYLSPAGEDITMGDAGITALTGDVTATGPGSAAATLASIITAGTRGSNISTPIITYDAKGRITEATSITTKPIILFSGCSATDYMSFPGSGGAILAPQFSTFAFVYFDNITQNFCLVISTSVVKRMVITQAVVASNFLTGLADDGTFSAAQPAVSDIAGFGAGVATWLATPSSANLAAAVTDETGTGALVFANSPTFTTPNIGSATGSITGNAGTATALATGRTISISGDLTYTSPSFDGTANVSAAGTLATVNSNVGTFGSATVSAQVTVNAKGLVTAAADVTITPAVGSITGLGANVATFLATPSSANLAAAVTDETGSGLLVFATSPTLTTPVLGVASATTINKVTITAPATGSTLTIDDGFTLRATGDVTALSGSHTGSSSGTNTGDQTSVTGNAGTVTVADAGSDTTTWVLLGTSQTGNLSPATDAGLTYNASTNTLTATGGVTVSGGAVVVTGVDSGSSSVINGIYTVSDPTTKLFVIGASLTPTFTANSSVTMYGFFQNVKPVVNATFTESGNIKGLYSANLRNFQSAGTDDDGTLSGLMGMHLLYGHFSTNSSAAPTTTTTWGMYLQPFANKGTIGTFYDLFIDTLSGGGTVTSRYSIYQADTSTRNYFGSNTTFAGSALSTSATAGIGYATGAGGAVTQGTSRTTGVTLNKICGAITLFSAAGSATPATFTVTNSAVAALDTVVLSVKSGTNVYIAVVTAVAAGSFNITFWTTGGTSTDSPVINFAVIKAVAS